jgi:hypothetical protein
MAASERETQGRMLAWLTVWLISGFLASVLLVVLSLTIGG